MSRRMYKPTITAIAVCLSLAVAPCLAATPEAKVINGSNATNYDNLLLPWQAAIKQSSNDTTGCGAVVIAEHWVVTAAHCDVDVIDDVVIAGTSFIPQGDLSLLDPKFKFEVNFRHHHEQYDSVTFANDIALFRVQSSLYSVAQPIKIATVEEQNAADLDFSLTWITGADSKANLIASGWGDTVTKGTYPSQLQVVKLGGIPDAQCDPTMTEPNYFVCADSNIAGLIKDVCAGDSGGPLIWQDPDHINDADKGLRVVGVTSNGTDCRVRNDNPNAPYFQGQYTQLSTYRNWIESTIRTADSNPSFTLSEIATPSFPSFSKDPFELVEDGESTIPSSGSSGGSTPLWGLAFLAIFGYLRRRT